MDLSPFFLCGGYGAIIGGNTAENAWLALTGDEGVEANVVGWTDAEIRNRIVTELNLGKQVSIATPNAQNREKGILTLPGPGGKKIYGDHAYVVEAPIDANGNGVYEAFRIYNPHGPTESFDLPIEYLSEVSEALYILNKN